MDIPLVDKVADLWAKGWAAVELLGRRAPVAPTPFDTVYRSM